MIIRHNGENVVNAGMCRVLTSDRYSLTVEVEGLDRGGALRTYRLIMSRDELATFARMAINKGE